METHKLALDVGRSWALLIPLFELFMSCAARAMVRPVVAADPLELGPPGPPVPGLNGCSGTDEEKEDDFGVELLDRPGLGVNPHMAKPMS
ncbi:hypothetical protein Ciccas_009799 [Cichlidogyrus casuarinus]|uniref:Secreted protein n=1 Tax=Cichlidogyrus casuarinus TaxID=1844966 RepID=A0ABD2PXH2_9PLAT